MMVKNTYPTCYKSKEERTEAVKKEYKKVILSMILKNNARKEEAKTP